MTDIKMIAANAVAQCSGLDVREIYEMLEFPPNDELGDVSLPCFKLSRTLRKAPAAIAAELAEKIKPEAVMIPTFLQNR